MSTDDAPRAVVRRMWLLVEADVSEPLPHAQLEEELAAGIRATLLTHTLTIHQKPGESGYVVELTPPPPARPLRVVRSLLEQGVNLRAEPGGAWVGLLKANDGPQLIIGENLGPSVKGAGVQAAWYQIERGDQKPWVSSEAKVEVTPQ